MVGIQGTLYFVKANSKSYLPQNAMLDIIQDLNEIIQIHLYKVYPLQT